MNNKQTALLTLILTSIGLTLPTLLSLTLQPGSSNTGRTSGIYFAEVTVVPADYAFIIWAPIYLGFLALAIYQVLPSQRNNPRFAKVRLWLSLSALGNAAWILIFNNLMFNLSAVIIVALLIMALVMHRTLEIGTTPVSGLERILRIPFSLYPGWLTVATVVNVAGALELAGWNAFGLSYATWGVVMLLVATAIIVLARFALRDPVYALACVWAFIGIVLGQSDIVPVAITAGVLAIFIAAAIITPRLINLKPSLTLPLQR